MIYADLKSPKVQWHAAVVLFRLGSSKQHVTGLSSGLYKLDDRLDTTMTKTELCWQRVEVRNKYKSHEHTTCGKRYKRAHRANPAPGQTALPSMSNPRDNISLTRLRNAIARVSASSARHLSFLLSRRMCQVHKLCRDAGSALPLKPLLSGERSSQARKSSCSGALNHSPSVNHAVSLLTPQLATV